jgi:hypothetical protein
VWTSSRPCGRISAALLPDVRRTELFTAETAELAGLVLVAVQGY